VTAATRVFVVTGGFGALGEAVAAALLARGDIVALVDFASAPPVAPAPHTLCFGGVDVADRQHAAGVMQRIFDATGRIDGLVNCAGGFRWQKLEDGPSAVWEDLYRLNVMTAVVACASVLPFLLTAGHGAIVNVGALGALKAAAGMGPYAASKAGVAALTQSLADETKDRNVTVNAVLPSVLDTLANRRDLPEADFTRWVTPRAVADVIGFLLSESSRAVTGALIPIAGRL
jgi:NAD(P)-dependent dehydrogenase (short-subunit alcohol dehydrogenase family)